MPRGPNITPQYVYAIYHNNLKSITTTQFENSKKIIKKIII